MATKPAQDAKNAIKSGRVQEGINYWCALFDYEAKAQDELTLKRGASVEVITKDPKVSGTAGWWTGKVNNKVGVFPSNFVEQVTPPQNKLPEIDFSEVQLGEVIGELAWLYLYTARQGRPSPCQQVCMWSEEGR